MKKIIQILMITFTIIDKCYFMNQDSIELKEFKPSILIISNQCPFPINFYYQENNISYDLDLIQPYQAAQYNAYILKNKDISHIGIKTTINGKLNGLHCSEKFFQRNADTEWIIIPFFSHNFTRLRALLITGNNQKTLMLYNESDQKSPFIGCLLRKLHSITRKNCNTSQDNDLFKQNSFVTNIKKENCASSPQQNPSDRHFTLSNQSPFFKIELSLIVKKDPTPISLLTLKSFEEGHCKSTLLNNENIESILFKIENSSFSLKPEYFKYAQETTWTLIPLFIHSMMKLEGIMIIFDNNSDGIIISPHSSSYIHSLRNEKLAFEYHTNIPCNQESYDYIAELMKHLNLNK